MAAQSNHNSSTLKHDLANTPIRPVIHMLCESARSSNFSKTEGSQAFLTLLELIIELNPRMRGNLLFYRTRWVCCPCPLKLSHPFCKILLFLRMIMARKRYGEGDIFG